MSKFRVSLEIQDDVGTTEIKRTVEADTIEEIPAKIRSEYGWAVKIISILSLEESSNGILLG